MIIGHQVVAHKAIPYLEGLPCDALFFIIDRAVMPGIAEELHRSLERHHVFPLEIRSEAKGLEELQRLWSWLYAEGATRESVVIAIGGGTLSDLVGFASATYMRGIRWVSIPTTLLGMVDASLGGKTAVDYSGVKNLLGAFHEPIETVIDTVWLRTLPLDELYSGYAEVIKTALLSGGDLWQQVLRQGDLQALSDAEWLALIETCATYKLRLVAADPRDESGQRAALNLGHTTAHALEAYSRAADGQRPLRHGEAVMIGLIVEGYLSMLHRGLDKAIVRQLLGLARELYSYYAYDCGAYPELVRLMQSDKKSSQEEIHFTLLDAPGVPTVWSTSEASEIEEALDFYRETFG